MTIPNIVFFCAQHILSIQSLLFSPLQGFACFAHDSTFQHIKVDTGAHTIAVMYLQFWAVWTEFHRFHFKTWDILANCRTWISQVAFTKIWNNVPGVGCCWYSQSGLERGTSCELCSGGGSPVWWEMSTQMTIRNFTQQSWTKSCSTGVFHYNLFNWSLLMLSQLLSTMISVVIVGVLCCFFLFKTICCDLKKRKFSEKII